MEWFDVVDAKGNPTGRTVERATAHAEGIRHRTAHIWVVRHRDGRDECLLQRRSLEKDSFPGQYDTSSAGHIRAGDEPLPSAVREIGEELGLQVKAEDLCPAGMFAILVDARFHDKPFHDHEVAFVYVLARDVDETKLVLQKEEVSSVRWFGVEETWRAVLSEDPRFCVPVGGLAILREYLASHPLAR